MEAPEAIQTLNRSMTPLEEAECDSRLWFIADACSAIVEFSSGKTLGDFKANEILQSGLKYELTLAGRALQRLAEHHPETARRLSEAPDMLTIADELAYGQPPVAEEKIWNVITTEVPPLLAEVRALLPSG